MCALGIDVSVLTERLTQLRNAIVRSVLFLVVASVGVYIFSEPLLTDLMRHMPGTDSGLVYLAPAEAFVTRIKLALAGGLVVSVPFLLFQVWSLAKPFLGRRQRTVALLMIPLAFGLFLAGAAFGYIVLLPVALKFLLGFGGPELVPMLAVGPYVGFVIMMVLPLGLIFQMPIVAVFLTRIGIIDPRSVAGRRKYAILIIFILSTILTPPDVFSQLLMAAPLLILFEVSLLVARIAGGGRSRFEAD